MKNLVLYKVNYKCIEWEEIVDFFKNNSFNIVIKNDPFLDLNSENITEIAKKIASIRIMHPLKKVLNPDPFPVEIEYEKKNILRKERKKGIVYSGLKLLNIYRTFIKEEFRNLKKYSIFVLTDQLIATYSDRWHLRVIIFSFPILISIPGMIEAPAKDREYYISETLGSVPELKDYYLNENDKRLTKILISYIIQGIFFNYYLINGKDFKFCDNKNCLLYNSHFQKEVIKAQYGLKLCQKHLPEWEEIKTQKE